MRFIFADSLDYVDPAYDFIADRNGARRVVHRDDEFPHEFLERAPYDGMLVSRGIVGDNLCVFGVRAHVASCGIPKISIQTAL
jgi:hypothetical protein